MAYNAEKLSVETEINIFRNMNTMHDVLKYASTNKYRRNILTNHVKTILFDNKKLMDDNFLIWYKVLTRFGDTNIENEILQKYFFEYILNM